MRALTLTEAAEALRPPIPRRELARRLKDVPSLGAVYGRRGRRAATYPAAEIMRAHAEWMHEREREKTDEGHGFGTREAPDSRLPVVDDDGLMGAGRRGGGRSGRGTGEVHLNGFLADDHVACQNSALEESA